jgi:hypothetical protein
MADSSGGLTAYPPAEVVPPHRPTEVTSQNLPTPVTPHAETEIPTLHPQTAVAAPHPPTEVASHAQDGLASAQPPTEMAMPYPETEAAGCGSGVPAQDERKVGQGVSGTQLAAGQIVRSGRPAGTVRHGPGVPVPAPAGQAGQTAEQVWRTGRLPGPPRRRHWLRRVASGALTVILLAAAGVVLYLRLYHAPLQVTGVAVTRQVPNGCVVNVTGRIATNGSAGTVSYQWLLQPQSQAPQPMSQPVVAGQDAVYVTIALQGQGRGSVARAVTLQVLGPGTGTATAHVAVSC